MLVVYPAKELLFVRIIKEVQLLSIIELNERR